MTTWLESISNGLTLASVYGLLLIIPATVVSAFRNRGTVNVKAMMLNTLFFVYLCCALALVFLPLPDADHLPHGYKLQLIPGFAVYDTIMDFKLVSVLQIVFNVLLTMPFGAYFYCKGKSFRQITLLTLAFSLFIEIGQLTGLFFIYDGSYRICDIDDLILNTLGGFAGAWAMSKVLVTFCARRFRPSKVFGKKYGRKAATFARAA